MHDLVAAQDIVKTAIKTAEKNKLKKITKISVTLGKIIEHNQEITPDNLKFNFNLVKSNTIAESAKLVISIGKSTELEITEVEGEK